MRSKPQILTVPTTGVQGLQLSPRVEAGTTIRCGPHTPSTYKLARKAMAWIVFPNPCTQETGSCGALLLKSRSPEISFPMKDDETNLLRQSSVALLVTAEQTQSLQCGKVFYAVRCSSTVRSQRMWAWLTGEELTLYLWGSAHLRQ